MGFYMKMLKVEIHFFRYSAISLFLIPCFLESLQFVWFVENFCGFYGKPVMASLLCCCGSIHEMPSWLKTL